MVSLPIPALAPVITITWSVKSLSLVFGGPTQSLLVMTMAAKAEAMRIGVLNYCQKVADGAYVILMMIECYNALIKIMMGWDMLLNLRDDYLEMCVWWLYFCAKLHIIRFKIVFYSFPITYYIAWAITCSGLNRPSLSPSSTRNIIQIQNSRTGIDISTSIPRSLTPSSDCIISATNSLPGPKSYIPQTTEKKPSPYLALSTSNM